MPWRMRLRSAAESVIPRALATMSSAAPPMLAKSEYGPAASPLPIEQDVCEPVLQHATFAECLFKVWLQGADVQQGLVDITDDDAGHAAVSLSVGEAASDSDGVRAAREKERPPTCHGTVCSRSTGRRPTVHVSGTV